MGNGNGGLLSDANLHAHDLLTYVNGPIDRVFAHLATRVNPIEVEDCAAVSVSMASGAVATLSATLGAADNTSRLRFMFSDLTAKPEPQPVPARQRTVDYHRENAPKSAAIATALSDFIPGNESFAGQFERVHAALTEAATPAPSPSARPAPRSNSSRRSIIRRTRARQSACPSVQTTQNTTTGRRPAADSKVEKNG